FIYFFQAEDGIRDRNVTGVQTCALPILFSIILVRSLTLVLGPIPRLYRLENEHENDTEHDESELEERHFREYVSRASAADVLEEIGRASCREREEIGGGAGRRRAE